MTHRDAHNNDCEWMSIGYPCIAMLSTCNIIKVIKGIKEIILQQAKDCLQVSAISAVVKQ